MPIEQLAQIIGSLTNEAQLVTLAGQFFIDARNKYIASGKDPDKFDVDATIKESHQDALDFFKIYSKIHADHIKEELKKHAGIQIATPNMSPEMMKNIKG